MSAFIVVVARLARDDTSPAIECGRLSVEWIEPPVRPEWARLRTDDVKRSKVERSDYESVFHADYFRLFPPQRTMTCSISLIDN